MIGTTILQDRTIGRIFSIGKKKTAKAQLKNVKLEKNGSSAVLEIDDKKLNLKTGLVGEFNLYNASQAAAVGMILKIEYQKIEAGISNLKEVSGRMQRIEAGQNFDVYVDFAITPDAIEKVLHSLQKITKGKVRIVFGATGDRDKQKRPEMGKVAAKYADYIYLTDDETYSEDPNQIRQAVYEGIKNSNGENKTQVIPDRENAIKTALLEAKKGDSVLLTGIGHENTRNMGGKLIPWDEVEIATKTLNKI